MYLHETSLIHANPIPWEFYGAYFFGPKQLNIHKLSSPLTSKSFLTNLIIRSKYVRENYKQSYKHWCLVVEPKCFIQRCILDKISETGKAHQHVRLKIRHDTIDMSVKALRILEGFYFYLQQKYTQLFLQIQSHVNISNGISTRSTIPSV